MPLALTVPVNAMPGPGTHTYGSSAAVGDLQDAVGSLRGELCGVRAELAETAGNLRQLTGLVQQLLAVGGIPAHHQLPALQHGAPGVRCQTVAAASLPLPVLGFPVAPLIHTRSNK